jgi:tetratricopeptide (TPR) repeat protein
MDNYHEAILSYEKALEIQKKGLPPNHPDLAITYNNIGRMFSKIGEYSKARFFHKNALIIQEKTLSWNHPDMLISYQALASVYHYMNQYSRALSLYQYVLDILQPSMSKYHPKIQDLQRNIELVKDELSFRCEFRTKHRNLFAYIRSLSFLQILFGLVFLIFFLYWFSCFNLLIYAMILYIFYILAYAFHFHSLPSPRQMPEDPLGSRLGVIFLYTYVLLQASPLCLCLLLFIFPPSFLTNALIRCHSILRPIIYFFK